MLLGGRIVLLVSFCRCSHGSGRWGWSRIWVGVPLEIGAPEGSLAILMTGGTAHILYDQWLLVIAITLMVAAQAIHLATKIMGRPRSQGMRKPARDVFIEKFGGWIIFQPDAQPALIMAGGAADARMSCMFRSPVTCLGIMAIGAFGRCPVCTMAAGAVPVMVRDGLFLFCRYFKTMPSLMALGAQFLHAIHRDMTFFGLIPVGDSRPVRIPHGFMAYRATDALPVIH